MGDIVVWMVMSPILLTAVYWLVVGAARIVD